MPRRRMMTNNAHQFIENLPQHIDKRTLLSPTLKARIATPLIRAILRIRLLYLLRQRLTGHERHSLSYDRGRRSSILRSSQSVADYSRK